MKFLSLTIPFVCWLFCFRHFLTGHVQLEADATSYAAHIGFYTDNLSHGIFPLWDPTWFNGAPNDFFLRRIGDVNPLLFLIVALKWVGVSSATAYLVFLGVYYFLAAWAFYLIARFLLVDHFFAFTAYILFLFSSWGSEIFYNYIIIIFVPIIWFFYFLLCFSRTAQKGPLLGMALCMGLIFTTYIPFFFLTILTIFTFFYLLFYGKESISFFKRCFTFFNKNKVFTSFCLVFILMSCIPALLFYKESKAGEFVMPVRHAGADTASPMAVSMEKVASGDIINHGYFDRLFDDHAHLDMGDIYIPYVFFLILLATVFARADKLIFFLLFNILALSLITVTTAAGVHRFLYDHIIFFRFIRNIYYFFWLAMLPMAILLSVCAFKSLLTAVDNARNKIIWLVYIIFCHVLFILFLSRHEGVLWCAGAAVVISMVYFFVYFYFEKKISYPAGFCLLLLAIFLQSAQVYGSLEKNIFQVQHPAVDLEKVHQDAVKRKMDLYYSSNFFAILVNYIDPQVLDDYRNRQFIFYENVVPYRDSPEFFKALQAGMTANANIAFLPRFESQSSDWQSDHDAGGQADSDPVHSGKLSLVNSDANTWDFNAHLPQAQFLVINSNYNSHWHALINGQEVHVFRANYSFIGLWVPSGESHIIVRFSSPRMYIFRFGLIALFAGTFLYLIWLFVRQRRSGPYV